MTALQKSSTIYLNETERKPNLYSSRVLTGVVAVIAIAWLFNETGIFTLDKDLVRICLLASVSQLMMMRLIVRNPDWIIKPEIKYIFMGFVLSLVLTVTVLLNIHAVLAYVLPLLVATQYRSLRISRVALIGSCLACLIAPVLSYLLGTWNLTFMTGYIQTFCRVTIAVTEGNGISALDAIYQITLYWSLPQTLTLAAFGVILFSVTRNGIDGVENQMQVVDLSSSLASQLDSILTMQERMLYTMSDIIENRDTDTGGHVRRTSQVVRLLMRAMQRDPASGVTDSFCSNVIKCAPLHDLGKIAVPDTILKKSDSLTDEEYAVIKLHPVKSAEIITSALSGIEDEQLMAVAVNIAKYHHERVDGTGYPERLRGCDIPLEARIMAIADVYDALVSKRCYKEPMPFDTAFHTVEALMGSQFDPALNKYFVSCIQDIEEFYSSSQFV